LDFRIALSYNGGAEAGSFEHSQFRGGSADLV
jgi:hypothetical protein